MKMKFKIKLDAFNKIAETFHRSNSGEIELEPCDLKAIEAMYKQQIETVAFERGHKLGYQEGWHDARKREYLCGCGCMGNNCWKRHCTSDCWKTNS